MRKIKNCLILSLLMILISLTGCIYEKSNDERPKTVTVKGYVMVDEDGIGVGQPATPVTEVEDYFVVYTKNEKEQSITSDIEDAPLVSSYVEQNSGAKVLPKGITVYTNTEDDENYAEDGYFEVEVALDAHTIWAGIPTKGYDVNFFDLTGKLKLGEILGSKTDDPKTQDWSDEDYLRIVLTPRASGVAKIWVGPDDVAKGKFTTQNNISIVKVKGEFSGWNTFDMNQWEENPLYWWYELKTTPGNYKYGFEIGEKGDPSWYLPARGDSVGVDIGLGKTIDAKLAIVGKTSGAKYTPAVSGITLEDSKEYIITKAGDKFEIIATVESKYIPGDNVIKSVKIDLSELSLGTVDMTVKDGATYTTGELTTTQPLKSGKYVIKINAEDKDGGKSETMETIIVNSKPIIGDSNVYPQTLVIGDAGVIGIESSITEESNGKLEVKAVLENGQEIEMFDDGTVGDKLADDGIYTLKEAYLLNAGLGEHVINIVATNELNEIITSEINVNVVKGQANVKLTYEAELAGELTYKIYNLMGYEVEYGMMEYNNELNRYESNDIELYAGDYRYVYFENGEEITPKLKLKQEDLLETINNELYVVEDKPKSGIPTKILIFDGRDKATVTSDMEIYVMGSLTNWDTGAKMTQIGDKVWMYLAKAEIGEYEYKFRANGDWATQWNQAGEGTPENGNPDSTIVKFTANDALPTKVLIFDGRNKATVTSDMELYVMGTLTNWDAGAKMTQIGDKVWMYLAKAEVGEYEYKFRANGDWGTQWNQAGEGTPENGNPDSTMIKFTSGIE